MAQLTIFHYFAIFVTLASVCGSAGAPSETTEPQIVQLDCVPEVACITRYGAVLPEPFNRTDGGAISTYGDTNATGVPGFSKLNDYQFLAFDDRFIHLLGRNATYQYFFNVADTNHEVS